MALCLYGNIYVCYMNKTHIKTEVSLKPGQRSSTPLISSNILITVWRRRQKKHRRTGRHHSSDNEELVFDVSWSRFAFNDVDVVLFHAKSLASSYCYALILLSLICSVHTILRKSITII